MRRFLAACLFSGVMFAQSPVITPTTPAVYQGKSTTFSCSSNCGTGGAWSVSAGTGTINSSTGAYTAPALITPQQTIGGYPMYPNNHIYNVDISGLSVRSDSADLLSGMGSIFYYSGGTFSGTAGQYCTLTITGATGSGGVFQLPLTGTNTVSSGSQATIVSRGTGYSGNQTSGTVSNGTATCSGTVTISSIPTSTSNNLNYLSSFPINYTSNSTGTDTMTFHYHSSLNGLFQVPVYPYGKMEGSWNAGRTISDNGDHHFLKFNTETGAMEDQYQYYNYGVNTLCLSCNSQDGAKYSIQSYSLPSPSSADAAGMQLIPVTLRADEANYACANNTPINHALRLTLAGQAVAHDPDFLWPAIVGSFNSSGLNKYGERLRLKSSYNITGFSSCAQILLTQLKNYGMVLADAANNGSGFQITTEYEGYSKQVGDAFKEIAAAGINNLQLEIVDESSLMVSATSGLANTGRETVCYTSSTGTTCTDVALLGPAVNLPQTTAYVMAGTPAHQFSAWVSDGGSNAATWSMSPTVGTLTSGGLYTAPATVASPTSTTVTVTSTANSNVKAQMTLWVFPTTGLFAIPSTPSTEYGSTYTDTLGNVWTAEFGFGLNHVPAIRGCCNHDSSSNFTGFTDYKLFWDGWQSSATLNDIYAEYIVPRGRYQITYNLGTNAAAGVTYYDFWSNGGSIATDIDPTTVVGQYQKYTLTTTQSVGSDHILRFWVLGNGTHNGITQVGTNISSISVVPAPPSNNTFNFGGSKVAGVSAQ